MGAMIALARSPLRKSRSCFEVALLLAPDGRNGLGVGRNAVLPMACRAELRFRLDLIRGMRRRDGERKADPHSENRRKEACVHDEIPPSPPRGQSVAGYRIVFIARTLCEPS